MIIAGEAERDGRKRITCPLDKKHTVFDDQLAKHLKKCNQTKKTRVEYYTANINSGILNYSFCPDEKVSLSTVSKNKVTSLIEKVKKYHKGNVSVIPSEVLCHSVFQRKMAEMSNKPVILKHLKQQASLIDHMDKMHLLKSNTVFMEFGAGRGKLSHWLKMAVGNSAQKVDYILIDRANNRYKYDRYHRGEDQGPSFQRINLDIEHLDISKVPCLKNNEAQKIVAVSKHLCGAATDLTLRCLMETLTRNIESQASKEEDCKDCTSDRESKRLKMANNTEPVKGIVLALCCHHCCSWPQYVGRPFLHNLGFTAEEFHLLCCLSSWATCGIRLKKYLGEKAGGTVGDTCTGKDSDVALESDRYGGHETSLETATEISGEFIAKDDKTSGEKRAEIQEDDRWSNYTIPEREDIGRQCKRIIDAGRLWYLESRDYRARLALYVDSSVSLENVVLLATPKI